MALYGMIDIDALKSNKLAALVRRVRESTRENADADMHTLNYSVFSGIFKKILPLARQAEEWYLYFYTMYYLMSLDRYNCNYREIVKYAELYYKDSQSYLDGIANPDAKMCSILIFIYDEIYHTYSWYAPIDDCKMELFMQNYSKLVFKYNIDIDLYYISELYLALLYRDTKRAEKAAKSFLKYSGNPNRCYVCNHFAYLFYLLHTDQKEQAEELMLNFIHRNIPKRFHWCYRVCNASEPQKMYSTVLADCVHLGKIELFWYFYDTYWVKLPREARWNKNPYTLERLFNALEGNFDGLENDLEITQLDLNNEPAANTIENTYNFLAWWCYFILLHQKGVQKVKLSIPQLDSKNTGFVFTLALSRYMEQKADLYGKEFARAREKYDYDFEKMAYQSIFLESTPQSHPS